jgi:hypothetical protein
MRLLLPRTTGRRGPAAAWPALFAALLLAQVVRPAHALQTVRVVELTPDVQVRAEKGEWQDATVGMELTAGHEVSSTPDGRATLRFENNSTVVIQSTTQIKIASFFRQGGVVKTEILLKLGEIAAQVSREKTVRSDFQIRSPTATASVRGTEIHAARYTPTRGFQVALASGVLHVSNPTGSARLGGGDTARTARSGEVKSPLAVTREAQASSAFAPGSTPDEVQALQNQTQPTVGDARSSNSQPTFFAVNTPESRPKPPPMQAPPEMPAVKLATFAEDPAGLFALVNGTQPTVEMHDDQGLFGAVHAAATSFDDEGYEFLGDEDASGGASIRLQGQKLFFPSVEAVFDHVIGLARQFHYPESFIQGGIDLKAVALTLNTLPQAPIPGAVLDNLQAALDKMLTGELAAGAPPTLVSQLRANSIQRVALTNVADRVGVLKPFNTWIFPNFDIGVFAPPLSNSPPFTFRLRNGSQLSAPSIGQLIEAAAQVAENARYNGELVGGFRELSSVILANPVSSFPASIRPDEVRKVHSAFDRIFVGEIAAGYRPVDVENLRARVKLRVDGLLTPSFPGFGQATVTGSQTTMR